MGEDRPQARHEGLGVSLRQSLSEPTLCARDRRASDTNLVRQNPKAEKGHPGSGGSNLPGVKPKAEPRRSLFQMLAREGCGSPAERVARVTEVNWLHAEPRRLDSQPRETCPCSRSCAPVFALVFGLVFGLVHGLGHEAAKWPAALASNSFRLESTKGMSTERRLLDHEKLDVYRLAIEFLTFALPSLDALPRARRELHSQLERAAMSVPLNIAAERVNAFETVIRRIQCTAPRDAPVTPFAS